MRLIKVNKEHKCSKCNKEINIKDFALVYSLCNSQYTDRLYFCLKCGEEYIENLKNNIKTISVEKKGL